MPVQMRIHRKAACRMSTRPSVRKTATSLSPPGIACPGAYRPDAARPGSPRWRQARAQHQRRTPETGIVDQAGPACRPDRQDAPRDRHADGRQLAIGESAYFDAADPAAARLGEAMGRSSLPGRARSVVAWGALFLHELLWISHGDAASNSHDWARARNVATYSMPPASASEIRYRRSGSTPATKPLPMNSSKMASVV